VSLEELNLARLSTGEQLADEALLVDLAEGEEYAHGLMVRDSGSRGSLPLLASIDLTRLEKAISKEGLFVLSENVKSSIRFTLAMWQFSCCDDTAYTPL